MKTYLGIDPEPTGAYCFITKRDEKALTEYRAFFYTSYKDCNKRARLFKEELYKFIEGTELDVPFPYLTVIEDAWIYPGQAAQAMTKYIKSQGVWLGILATLDFESHIVAPRKWKRELSDYCCLVGHRRLSKDKNPSFVLTKEIIREEFDYPEETISEYLRLSKGVNSKQIYDRCEAFLMAYYGMNLLEDSDEDTENTDSS